MLWLNDAVIEVMRQGLPIVTSVTATAWGTTRMAGKGQSPKVRHVALYSGAGWLGGYVVRSILMKVLEGSNKALPGPSDMVMPEPATTSGPMMGLPPQPPIGNHVGEVMAIPIPSPKKQPTLVDVSARGENISIQGTMDSSSMGSAYGG